MKLNNLALVGSLTALLSACGGSGGDAAAVEGGIVKGPMLGATVCAYLLENGAKGAQLPLDSTGAGSGRLSGGCYITGADGSYAFSVPRNNVDILLEATGGTYCTDELPVSGGACTGGGTLVTMTETMTAAARAASVSRSTVFVTPLTTAAIEDAAGNGGISVDRFAARFAVLAGQVIGDSTVSPSTPPTPATQPYLQQVADHMKGGGRLADAVSALKQGSTDFAGGSSGIPENAVAATIHPDLVGQYALTFTPEACPAPACPFSAGQMLTAAVHGDGRLDLGTRTLRNPFHRKLYGGANPHLPEIIWRDSAGIEYALSDNTNGTFNEINVGDGNRLVMPGGFPTFMGQLRLQAAP